MTPPPTAPSADANAPPDWDQLGLPVGIIEADGRLQRGNQAFRLLLLTSLNEADATPMDWVARFEPASRAAIFTALADRRSATNALAWRGTRSTPVRWFTMTLRWRHTGTRCVATFHDVTLLHNAERAVRQQLQRLHALVDQADVVLAAFDADSLLCTEASRGFARVFDADAGAVQDRTLVELVGGELARALQPALDELRATRTRVSFNHDVTLPRGESRCYTLTVSPHFDRQGDLQEVLLQLEDITRHQQVERAMSQAEQRLDRFMQAATEGMVLHDAGTVVDANPAFCAWVGSSLHELIGRRLTELAAPGQAPRLEALLARTDGGRDEVTFARRQGGRLLAECITQPSDDHEPWRMVVVRDVSDRHAAQARLHYLAHHDALTGLPNRQAILAQLEHLMLAARASQTQLGLLFIDLDHFKRVNDSLGHASGDVHLKTVARRISEQVRSTDRVARFGGDEFMVLLPGLHGEADAQQVARKLISAIAAPMAIGEGAEGTGPISVTPSIGVALFPEDGDTPDLLIKHADTALHVAKSRGRATFARFEAATARSAYANIVLEGQLGQAVTNQEFELLFQPQVRARDGRPTGAEALIRWQHPQRGLLKPDEFIALAEQHRLMLPIGQWVLQEAGRFAQRWHADRPDVPLGIAVNLSTLQFQAPDFVASIEAVLQEVGAPRGWLELELTERMLMDDLPHALERLMRLRQLGVKLSVDDFGTGYSSLAQLKRLPIDKIKIDRSFVKSLPGDRPSAAIVGAVVQIARGLDLKVVAEGVETEAQQRHLADAGCDQLQGMGISVPLDAQAFAAWLQARLPSRGAS